MYLEYSSDTEGESGHQPEEPSGHAGCRQGEMINGIQVDGVGGGEPIDGAHHDRSAQRVTDHAVQVVVEGFDQVVCELVQLIGLCAVGVPVTPQVDRRHRELSGRDQECDERMPVSVLAPRPSTTPTCRGPAPVVVVDSFTRQPSVRVQGRIAQGSTAWNWATQHVKLWGRRTAPGSCDATRERP